MGDIQQEFYPTGTYIVRQGARGDNFFIIASGRVRITQRLPGTSSWLISINLSVSDIPDICFFLLMITLTFKRTVNKFCLLKVVEPFYGRAWLKAAQTLIQEALKWFYLMLSHVIGVDFLKFNAAFQQIDRLKSVLFQELLLLSKNLIRLEMKSSTPLTHLIRIFDFIKSKNNMWSTVTRCQ